MYHAGSFDDGHRVHDQGGRPRVQVLVGIQRVDIGMGFEAGLAIVILMIIFDRITQNLVPKYGKK